MKPPSRRLPLAVAMTRCVMLAALVATPALAGCADDDGDRAMGSSPALLAAPIHSSVCADGPTTYGIDVSKWQGTINWSQVPNSGVKFAIIRVSDGTNTMDAQFAANWAGAKANGILRGAYQFFRPSQDAVAQANVLLNTIASDPGEIPPVIDVEVTSDQTPAVVAQKVGQWLQRVEEVLHVKPIIYTGGYFWDSNVASTAYAAYPLWTAHWGTSCPNTPNAWTRWAFHQFSATGSIAGISGDVDENRFNGDIDALKALAGPPPVNPACVEHGGADAAWCVDDTQLATCAAGAYSVGDCGAFGAKCSDGGGVGHCVHFACWTHLDGGEDGTFCVDADTLGSCADGQYTEVGCGGGWVCRLKGATAACVDPRCADLFAGGGDGHTCADADTIALCTGGAYSETPCGASRRCDA
ncbi:MAG: hypothetical protein KC635_20840, partial [Myxococcales bacterium]|nr:hypothetical protein [Myxococcales bacterium]